MDLEPVPAGADCLPKPMDGIPAPHVGVGVVLVLVDALHQQVTLGRQEQRGGGRFHGRLVRGLLA